MLEIFEEQYQNYENQEDAMAEVAKYRQIVIDLREYLADPNN